MAEQESMRADTILLASAGLLGVALLIVTAVHITDRAARSIADELGFAAALLFIGSCLVAHVAIGQRSRRYDAIAANFFVLALIALLLSVLSFWF